MSKTLEGEHLCLAHQGNSSHYAEHNCTICLLKAEIDKLKQIQRCLEASANGLAKDNDKLRAELAGYHNMKPLGEMLTESDMGIGYDRKIGNVLWFRPTAVKEQTLLFAHPTKGQA